MSTRDALIATVMTMTASLPATASPEKGFWTQVTDQLHAVLTWVGALGESRVAAGEIYVVAVGEDGRPGAARRIGAARDLSWPVIAPDGTVYALWEGRVHRVAPHGGSPGTEAAVATPVPTERTWRKLIGVTPEGVVLGFLTTRPLAEPAALTPAGELVLGPRAEEEEARRRVSVLLQESRAYSNGRALLVERSARGGRGHDIVLKVGERRWAVTDCADRSCGQPSLSADGRWIAYVAE